MKRYSLKVHIAYLPPPLTTPQPVKTPSYCGVSAAYGDEEDEDGEVVDDDDDDDDDDCQFYLPFLDNNDNHDDVYHCYYLHH